MELCLLNASVVFPAKGHGGVGFVAWLPQTSFPPRELRQGETHLMQWGRAAGLLEWQQQGQFPSPNWHHPAGRSRRRGSSKSFWSHANKGRRVGGCKHPPHRYQVSGRAWSPRERKHPCAGLKSSVLKEGESVHLCRLVHLSRNTGLEHGLPI